MTRSTPCYVLFVVLATACGDDTSSNTDVTPDQADTATDSDLGGEPDGPSDTPDLDDLDDTDLGGDTTVDVEDEPPPPPPCPEPPIGPAPPAGRWSLSLFHFNIQYVAGGSVGLAEIAFGFPHLAEDLDLTETEVEDQIIEQSVVPVLGILERNPELALTFEMQGLMVDVLRARHPDTLERMRVLAVAGQLELASIHWSDQFFLAFGREDMDESWRRTQASFAAADLPLSPVVFTQEGQFGEGFAAWLHETRPAAVAVLARNLQGFYRSGEPDAPLWSFDGLPVMTSRGLVTEIVDRQFSFFDDGELLATNDLNPYAGRLFVENAGAVRTYERALQCAHQNGYRVGRIADYAAAVEAELEELPEHGPILDGTWQPNSTRGPFRWLGGAGDVWARQEQDYAVLTTCHAARHQVLALAAVVDELGESAPVLLRDALDAAWRELLLGEVSDARGVNPWWGEVQYGLTHCGAAGEGAAVALGAERDRRGVNVLVIDSDAGTVNELGVAPADPTWSAAAAPIDVTVLETGERDATLTWERVGASGPYRLTVAWPARESDVVGYASCLDDGGEPWACRREPRPIALAVPRTPGHIGYRPALGETLVDYTEADFSFAPNALEDAAWSVAADGLVHLGEGRYLVQDVATAPLAVGWPVGEGRNDVVWIRDETLPRQDGVSWVVYYTESEAEALELATRNLRPVVVVD